MRHDCVSYRVSIVTLSPAATTLTDRQLEILHAYAESGSYQEAADRCGITVATVRATLQNIRAKLRVESSIQAAMIVFKDLA